VPRCQGARPEQDKEVTQRDAEHGRNKKETRVTSIFVPIKDNLINLKGFFYIAALGLAYS